MRHDLALLSIALLGPCGCALATGQIVGGDPLLDASAPRATDAAGVTGPSTWTGLYADYFGPGGKANCSSQSLCHGAADSTGTVTSGFVCGPTKAACWQGMTVGVGCSSAVPPCPIVSTGPAQDPTLTGLYKTLRKPDAMGKVTGNMPLFDATGTSPGYTFTRGDMARIAEWIQKGALNN